jgi:hypothetical protein
LHDGFGALESIEIYVIALQGLHEGRGHAVRFG